MKKVNATHFEEIPSFSSKKLKKRNIAHLIVETPKGSRHKYALNNEYGIIAFSEVLPEGMEWPFDYGFIPQTLAQDGDPLDVLVLTETPLFSGCLIEARIIGAVKERKNGVENDRLVAVPLPSPGAPAPTDRYRTISDLPEKLLRGITEFLVDYSQRAGNRIDIEGMIGCDEAMKSIRKTAKAFRKKSE